VLISSAGTRCVRFSAQKHCKNNRGDKSVTALPSWCPKTLTAMLHSVELQDLTTATGATPLKPDQATSTRATPLKPD
jgi:hypothetical protein